MASGKLCYHPVRREMERAMPKTILCFGDSNTFGTPPMTDLEDSRRFPRDTRWPTVMGDALGQDWTIIEEGLPGRTTVHDDPIEGQWKNGIKVLPAVIETHRPFDLILIMLGTNDLKTRFSLPASDIAASAGLLIDMARMIPPLKGLAAHQPLLIAPPPIVEKGCLVDMFAGGYEKSRGFGQLYGDIARGRGVPFLDAGTLVRSSETEGIHWDADQHVAFGRHMAGFVRGL
jgi:lysophospholipase L1-like esterase